MPQGLDVKLRQSGERVAQLSCREHERDLLRQQAASHERERPRRRTIEPLRVIDDTEERPLLRGLGQQAEDRQSDQERIRALARALSPNATPSASRWGCGRRSDQVEERGTQLLKRCERELHLRFDPECPGDPKLARSLDRVLEQRGLADARFAVHHQHAAVSARTPSSSRSSTSRSRSRPSNCPPDGRTGGRRSSRLSMTEDEPDSGSRTKDSRIRTPGSGATIPARGEQRQTSTR